MQQMDDAARTTSGTAEGGGETTSRAGSLGPVAAGFLLDLVDLATFGPIGLWTGAVLGGLAGYFLAAALNVLPKRRWVYAGVAAVYCTLPFTAFLPCATLLGTIIRWRETRPQAVESKTAPGATPVIEAEYESRWDRP